METRKERILRTLDAFVNQRPGLDPREYTSDGYDPNGWKIYRQDSREITRQMHDYYAIKNVVEARDSITADDIVKTFAGAFSGRLEITEDDEKVTLHYTAGQYMPTEYRAAAASVMASCLWAATLDDCPQEYGDDPSPGDWMRQTFRRQFGRGLQSRYFN